MSHAFVPLLLVLLYSRAAWITAALPASSGSGELFLQLVAIIFAILFFGILAIPKYDKLFALPGNRKRAIGLVLITFLVPATVYLWTWRSLHPDNIRYTFDYGQSGSWHEVQFTLLLEGRTIKGPWIGGNPLDVRFPDLNGDGHPDIRVSKANRVTEFVYLPAGDGECYWHLKQNSGYCVDYPPDGQHYP